ncbi:MAG TPA: hypothetical protein VJ757_05845 [Pseudonocardiaceae bacterium]|nr:hypothetical protein [Pseudonocardiaceae bacterium]
MADTHYHVRVPVLMVAWEADVVDGVLKITGQTGVVFPPQLPAEITSPVVAVVENPSPDPHETTMVRISIAGPDGEPLAGSVHDYEVRWDAGSPPGAPRVFTIIEQVSVAVHAEGRYDVAVFIDNEPTPRAVTSFGVFLK